MVEIIYSDKLVEITTDIILFRHYYFPLGSKKIHLKDVENVKLLSPNSRNGKWRIHGTGDFHTWFPFDAKRSTREMIFIIVFHKRWWQIGFTVENPNIVRNFFKDKDLMKQDNFI